ncbi:MAG TPA: hypothetical protein VIU11_23380 [Nakamurella sp.]
MAATPGLNGDEPYSAARWWWPHDTRCEIWDFGSRSWLPNDSFESINTDTKWTRVTEREVSDWIAGGPAQPG